MPIRRILFPTDFSEAADPALRHAVFLAERLGAALHVLHVVEDGNPSARALEIARAELDAYAESLAVEAGPAERAVVAHEAAGPAIAAYAEEHGIDLIAMGTHGRRGLKRLFLGSVAEETFRAAPCPVIAFREHGAAFPVGPLDAVLCPLDLSDVSHRALPTAREFAAAYEASLHLLHVFEPVDLPAIYSEDLENPLARAFPEARERVRAEMEAAAATAAGPEVPTEVHFAEGYAADAIVDYAEEHGVDLIVLTRTGWRGLTRFLMGSVADKVVRAAPCPVLVVPVPVPKA